MSYISSWLKEKMQEISPPQGCKNCLYHAPARTGLGACNAFHIISDHAQASNCSDYESKPELTHPGFSGVETAGFREASAILDNSLFTAQGIAAAFADPELAQRMERMASQFQERMTRIIESRYMSYLSGQPSPQSEEQVSLSPQEIAQITSDAYLEYQANNSLVARASMPREQAFSHFWRHVEANMSQASAKANRRRRQSDSYIPTLEDLENAEHYIAMHKAKFRGERIRLAFPVPEAALVLVDPPNAPSPATGRIFHLEFVNTDAGWIYEGPIRMTP